MSVLKPLRYRGKPNRRARKAGKMALRRHRRLTAYLQDHLPVCIPRVDDVREGGTLRATVLTPACGRTCAKEG